MGLCGVARIPDDREAMPQHDFEPRAHLSAEDWLCQVLEGKSGPADDNLVAGP